MSKCIRTHISDCAIDSWKFAAITALSFSVPFMLLFYTPLDIYLHNPMAFVVGWRLLVPHLLLLFMAFVIMLFAALLLICFLLIALLKKEKAADIILLGLLGFLLSAYVQTLFLNGNMEPDVGGSSLYSALTLQNIINLLIWLAILLVPIGLWTFLSDTKKHFRFEKVIVFTAVIIAGMQITGLLATFVSAELPGGLEDDAGRYVSFENALDLSAEKNILVFVLDALDVKFINEAFEKHPYLKDTLYGFTFYQNNVSEFFETLPSVVSMLTQVYYSEGQPIGEYLEEAWAAFNIVDRLRAHGFTTNLYLCRRSTIGSLRHIEDRTDNIRELPDGFDASVNTSNFISIITRLSLGRISPYLLKNIFLDHVRLDFGNRLFSFTHHNYEMAGAQPSLGGMYHDERLLEFITQNEITSDIENGVFKFFHLYGAHSWPEVVNNIPSVLQNFEILSHFFDNMKRLGIYDSSTIIIVGDHGRGRGHAWSGALDLQLRRMGLGLPITTSLFIKPPESTGALIIDSVSEMSNRYFAASILQIAGLSHDELGLSYFDILDGAVSRPRVKHDLTAWWRAFADGGTRGYMTLYGIYEITGDANDAANWVFVPNDR